jgi:hypothetical protein
LGRVGDAVVLDVRLEIVQLGELRIRGGRRAFERRQQCLRLLVHGEAGPKSQGNRESKVGGSRSVGASGSRMQMRVLEAALTARASLLFIPTPHKQRRQPEPCTNPPFALAAMRLLVSLLTPSLQSLAYCLPTILARTCVSLQSNSLAA